MGHICEELLPEPLTPDREPLCMTARAEHADFATICHEKLRLALGTDNPSEPVFEDAAVEVLVDGFFDARSQGSILLLEAFVVREENIFEENKLDKIDFLKLDCEGSEGSILLSTPKPYLQRIAKIAIEFHDNVSQLNHQEIRELLEDVGFTTELSWDEISPFGYLYGIK